MQHDYSAPRQKDGQKIMVSVKMRKHNATFTTKFESFYSVRSR